MLIIKIIVISVIETFFAEQLINILLMFVIDTNQTKMKLSVVIKNFQMCQKTKTSALYHFICILISLVLIKILRFYQELCVILVSDVHSLITDGVTYLLYNTCIIKVNL